MYHLTGSMYHLMFCVLFKEVCVSNKDFCVLLQRFMGIIWRSLCISHDLYLMNSMKQSLDYVPLAKIRLTPPQHFQYEEIYDGFFHTFS